VGGGEGSSRRDLERSGKTKIETFRPEHAEQVAELCRAEGWDFWEDVGAAERALLAPSATTLIACEDGRVIGAAEVLSDGAINWVLGVLVVAPEHRGRGIGKALVRAAFAATGARRLDVLTEDEGPAFYRSLPGREMSGFRLYPP
jgi:predicted N-acetyltransferase YhbS